MNTISPVQSSMGVDRLASAAFDARRPEASTDGVKQAVEGMVVTTALRGAAPAIVALAVPSVAGAGLSGATPGDIAEVGKMTSLAAGVNQMFDDVKPLRNKTAKGDATEVAMVADTARALKSPLTPVSIFSDVGGAANEVLPSEDPFSESVKQAAGGVGNMIKATEVASAAASASASVSGDAKKR